MSLRGFITPGADSKTTNVFDVYAVDVSFNGISSTIATSTSKAQDQMSDDVCSVKNSANKEGLPEVPSILGSPNLQPTHPATIATAPSPHVIETLLHPSPASSSQALQQLAQRMPHCDQPTEGAHPTPLARSSPSSSHSTSVPSGPVPSPTTSTPSRLAPPHPTHSKASTESLSRLLGTPTRTSSVPQDIPTPHVNSVLPCAGDLDVQTLETVSKPISTSVDEAIQEMAMNTQDISHQIPQPYGGVDKGSDAQQGGDNTTLDSDDSTIVGRAKRSLATIPTNVNESKTKKPRKTAEEKEREKEAKQHEKEEKKKLREQKTTDDETKPKRGRGRPAKVSAGTPADVDPTSSSVTSTTSSSSTSAGPDEEETKLTTPSKKARGKSQGTSKTDNNEGQAGSGSEGATPARSSTAKQPPISSSTAPHVTTTPVQTSPPAWIAKAGLYGKESDSLLQTLLSLPCPTAQLQDTPLCHLSPSVLAVSSILADASVALHELVSSLPSNTRPQLQSDNTMNDDPNLNTSSSVNIESNSSDCENTLGSWFASPSTHQLLGRTVQDSCHPLNTLTRSLHSTLFPSVDLSSVMSSSIPPPSLFMLEQALLMGAERKAYGLTRKDAVKTQDTDEKVLA